MAVEVVTLISKPAEVPMVYDHLIDRDIGIQLTVLLQPGIEFAAPDCKSIQVLSIGATGLVEQALKDYTALTTSPWLLQVDPDELWPEEAFRRAEELSGALDQSEAAAFPMTYFVGSRPLRGGPWSRVYPQRLNSRSLLAQSTAEVHLRPPASRVEKVALRAPVRHFWVNDLRELRTKHDLYLANEGTARVTRFGRHQTVSATIRTARTVAGCIRSAPWRDGLLGIRLAAEMVRYQHKANLAWKYTSKRLEDRGVDPQPSRPGGR
jgi:hypothetical protein